MDRIAIRGGRPLTGRIPISGAKNAALPLMAAALLTDETLTLTNVPRLVDIRTLLILLQQHGVAVEERETDDGAGRTVAMTAGTIASTTAPL